MLAAWRLGASTIGSLSAFSLAMCCALQAAPAPLPSADQILAKYEKFLGGAAALAKVDTRTVHSRRIEISGEPSDEILVRFSKRPAFSIMHHEALDGSFIRYMNGCDAAGGWVGYGKSATETGAPKAGESSTDGVCQQEQFYYGYLPLDLARLRGNVKRLEVKATTDIVTAEPTLAGSLAGGHGRDLVPAGRRRVYLVLAVPARDSDQYVWMYFDTDTGALLRRADAGHGATPAQPGTNPRYTDFIQYRDVGDGTRAPFQFVTTAPNSQVRGVETSIVDNQPIADDVFPRPKDVRREDKGAGQ